MKYIDGGKINPDIADTLYELSNVGVGMASIVLGKMMGVSISIGIPKVVSVSENMDEIVRENPEKVAIGILMSLEKTLSGAVLFLIDDAFLSDLVAKLIKRELRGEELVEDEESLSAISEVANIMAASYMKAIGMYTGIRIYLSPVMVGVDMIGALISYPIAQLGIDHCDSICVDTSFAAMGEEKTKTAGRVIMFPNEESVDQIIGALRE